jgi:hypothetical protein
VRRVSDEVGTNSGVGLSYVRASLPWQTMQLLRVVCSLAFILSFTTCAVAATYRVDPKGSYIYVNIVGDPSTGRPQDVVVAPTIIDLSMLGVKEGDLINATTFGDMSFSCYPGVAGSCVISSGVALCGVFSSSSLVLPPGSPSTPQVNRVPGALAPTFDPPLPCPTIPTYAGGIATDIPEDFLIDGSPVVVPKGARYLIVAVPDSFYADNADPNGRLAVNVIEGGQSSIPAGMSAHLRVNDTTAIINQVFSVVRTDPQNSALTENQIAEKAWSAIVDARNGYFGPNNQFAFLQNVDLVTISNADHFAQTYYVSTGNTLVNNPLSGAILGAVIDPVYNLGKAIASSAGFDFFATGDGPQSPANFDFWALAGADAALDEAAPGTSTDVAPILTGDDTSVFVAAPIDSVGVPLDPPIAYGFSYEVLGGGSVTSLRIPSSALSGVSSYSLVYGTTTATVSADSVYTFRPPVTRFTVEGLMAPAQTRTAQKPKGKRRHVTTAAEFKSVLTFSPSGIAAILQTACDQPINPLGVGGGCDGTYCGTYNGDILVSQGQQCIFTSGQIHGSIFNDAGILSLDATTVFGDLRSVGGTTDIGPTTQINGRFYVDSRSSASRSDPRAMWIPILASALVPTGTSGEYASGGPDVRISAPIVAGRKTGTSDIDRLRIYPPVTVEPQNCTMMTTVKTEDPNFLVLETANADGCGNGTLIMTVAWIDIVSVEVVQ